MARELLSNPSFYDQNGVHVHAPPRSRQSCGAPLSVAGHAPPHVAANDEGPHVAVVCAQPQLAGITPAAFFFAGVNVQAWSAGHAPPHCDAAVTVAAKPHAGGGVIFAAGAQIKSAMPTGIVRAANWSTTPTFLGALFVVQVME